MVEAFHKTCNIKHEIDIKRYGNAKKIRNRLLTTLLFRIIFSYSFLFFLKIHADSDI